MSTGCVTAAVIECSDYNGSNIHEVYKADDKVMALTIDKDLIYYTTYTPTR